MRERARGIELAALLKRVRCSTREARAQASSWQPIRSISRQDDCSAPIVVRDARARLIMILIRRSASHCAVSIKRQSVVTRRCRLRKRRRRRVGHIGTRQLHLKSRVYFYLSSKKNANVAKHNDSIVGKIGNG